MNIDLLSRNCGATYPEEFECALDTSNAQANTCRFNRWGTLLAVGSTDGRLCIYDFTTKRLVKMWQAHGHPLVCVAWSRDGRRLLTAASDCSAAVWDVMQSRSLQRIVSHGLPISMAFNPRNADQILVLQLGFAPYVEYLSAESKRQPLNCEPVSSDDSFAVAAFDHRGQYIIAGSNKGRLVVYDAKSLDVKVSCRQSSTQPIKGIVATRQGDWLATNTADRVIRVYHLPALLQQGLSGAQVEPTQKLSDIVNKAAWRTVCVSQNGDYVCGASNKSHSLYIWERISGTLVKMLHGSKGETVMDAHWHPTRPVIVSVASGQVSIWTQTNVENWSAFAPEFKELEENAKHIEREGEFDMEDEDDERARAAKDKDDDELDVDVVGLTANDTLCSSDEEIDESFIRDYTCRTGPLWYLPVTSEFDVPDEPVPKAAELVEQLRQVPPSEQWRHHHQQQKQQQQHHQLSSGTTDADRKRVAAVLAAAAAQQQAASAAAVASGSPKHQQLQQRKSGK